MTITELKTARHLGLGLTSLETLFALAEQGSQTLGDLAIYIGVSTASFTATADSLVKKGLASRVHGTTDRRKIHLRLTGKGEQAYFHITARQALLKI